MASFEISYQTARLSQVYQPCDLCTVKLPRDIGVGNSHTPMDQQIVSMAIREPQHCLSEH